MNKLLTLIRQPFISLKYYSKHRDNNIWIFGEWFGTKACDNSLYLANYICNAGKEIKCYWIANIDADLHLLDKKIEVLIRDSRESKKIFKNCGVVIMNQGFIDFSSSANNYFKGALTLNLWHGIAWKKIYFDTVKNYQFLKPILSIYKNELMANYYLAPSKEYEKICKSAFLAGDKIIYAGQPRNSLLFDNSYTLKQIFLNKNSLNNNTKIICYLPTFRSKNTNTFLFVNESNLNNILENNNSIIIQKRHFADNSINCTKTNEYIYNVSDLSAQEILQISDILITDYSSCFFDFLIKDKPVIHYLYDYDEYISHERQLYYKLDDVRCGDVCYKYDELLLCIESSLKNPNKDSELRKERKKRFIEKESKNNNHDIFEQITEILDAK